AQRRPPFCPVAVGLPGLRRPQKTRPLGAFCMSWCRFILIAVFHILNLGETNSGNRGEEAILNKF
ncbi:hypothetical protein ACVGXP_18835, partial [Enterobacter hormaechei]